LPFSLKLIPIFFVFVGGWLGYELSQSIVLDNIIINYNYINSILGGMWFIPKFRTYIIYGPALFTSNKYYENIDIG
jgi:hypothetical protein